MKNYDKVMEAMCPELLAELGVKLVNVDNRRLFYMTSSGQLFSMDDYGSALQHEYNWLMTDEDQPDAPQEEKDRKVDCDKESCDKVTDPTSN